MNDLINPNLEPEDDTASVAFPGIDTLKGKRLGEFRIVREIGRGSMGVVFEAVQENLDRRVAIKLLPPSINLPEKSIRRFLREAESVARLHHETIVQIYAIGQKDALYYYAMQYVDGTPLDEFLSEEHPLSFTRIARIMLQAARAIDYAHDHGIIHRDIKPGNILLADDDKVVITDFGLARQERGATLTESGALVGTPIYMSPEQVLGKKGGVGKRSDIYSLGVTLFELLTGKPPFMGTSTQEILNCILEEEPKAPRKIRSDVPWELDVIAMKAMEKEPRQRFATAGDLAADLRRYIDGEPILARPSGTVIKLAKKVRKHRVASALAGAAAILLIVILVNTVKSQGMKKNVEEYESALQQGRLLLNDMDNDNDNLAEEHFAKAIALFPEKAEAYFGLSQVFRSLANQEDDPESDAAKALRNQALEPLNMALNYDPQHTGALLARSRILRENSDTRGGLEDLLKLRTIDKENFTAAYECTETLYDYYHQLREEESDEDYMEVLNSSMLYGEEALKYGNNVEMRCLMAMIYYEKAKQCSVNRENVTPGSVNEEQKRYLQKAREEINLATELDKNSRKAFAIKEQINYSSEGSRMFELYQWAKNQGFVDSAVSQGSDILDFVTDTFLPKILPLNPGGEPARTNGEPEF